MKRRIALLVLLVSAALVSMWSFGYASQAGGQGAQAGVDKPSDADLRLVRGALDIDVHTDPDSVGPHSTQGARGADVIDVARRAKELGMRGFVIKQHYDQSAALAYVARKIAPGVEVFGGVIENFTVGGLNPASVYHLAEVKGGWGRVVFFPTWDSEVSVKQRAQGGQMGPFVPLVTAGGELVQAARDVIAAIASAKTRDSAGELVLETGYVTATEALAIVREGQKQGVKHMVVSHASGGPGNLSVAQMQEAARMGAFLEFAGVFTMGAKPLHAPAEYASMIRQIGIDNVIMASDFGQEGRPLPPDGLALYAGLMRKEGFTEQELHRMMAENPAKALGLASQTSGQ